jgi:hypothetical protein
VHEQQAGIGSRADGLGQQRAVHVGVPARLQQQRAAQRVGVLLQPGALLPHRLAGRGREAVDDEAQRFTGGVGVDRADAAQHASSFCRNPTAIISLQAGCLAPAKMRLK